MTDSVPLSDSTHATEAGPASDTGSASESALSSGYAAVVHNPTKIDRAELEAVVAAAEVGAGFGSTRWIETTEDDPGIAMARQAVDEGASVVIAAGGDGTVRAVAEGLRGGDVPMAILPAGTGNLLARNLGLPLDDPAATIDIAFTGTDRPLDVGTVEMVLADGSSSSTAFVVMTGIGLDADMLANTDDELKKKVGWIAYVKAGATALRQSENRTIRYRMDRRRAHALRVHTVLVGNCGSVQGNVAVLPDATPDDGLLDVAFLHPNGPLGWVQVAAHVLVGSRLRRGSTTGGSTRRAVRHMQGRTIAVRLPAPENLDVDGDLIEGVREFTCSIEAGALLVRLPRD